MATADPKKPVALAPLGRYVLFLIVIPWLVVSFTQGIRGHKAELSPPEILSIESRAGLRVDQGRIDSLMRPWLLHRLTDTGAHKTYVDLSIEARNERTKWLWGGSDDSLWSYYQALGDASSGAVRDAAVWGLAYCEFKRDSLQRVLEILDRIQDQHLPRADLIRGVALHGLGEHAKGDSVLYAAAARGESVKDATFALAILLLEQRDWDALDKLRRDPRTSPFVPSHVLRVLHLHPGELIPYFVQLVRSQRMPVKWVLVLLVLYTTGVWFFLIRWWDAFEKEPWSTSLIAVAMGALSPVGIYVFRDIASLFGSPAISGPLTMSFPAWVFSVGLVEECVKIAPVFVLGWLGARQMNERSDWMIYGCLSALGFSLNENYGYLVNHGLQVGVGRFFLSTPLHLSLTGFLALTLRRIYLREPQAWPRFLAALMGVAILHGTFDFLLDLHLVWAALAASLLGPLWGLTFLRIFGKVASDSPFRRNPVAFRASCTSWFMGAFAMLCLANYLALASVLGPGDATPKLSADLIGGQVFLLIGLVYSRLNFVRVEAILQPKKSMTSSAAGVLNRPETL